MATGHPAGVAPRAKESPLARPSAGGGERAGAWLVWTDPTRTLRRAARRRRQRACAGRPRPSCRHVGPSYGAPTPAPGALAGAELGPDCGRPYANAGHAVGCSVSLSSAATFVGARRTAENRSAGGGHRLLAGARRPLVGRPGGRGPGPVRSCAGAVAGQTTQAQGGALRPARNHREVRVPRQARAGAVRVPAVVVLPGVPRSSREAPLAAARRLARRASRRHAPPVGGLPAQGAHHPSRHAHRRAQWRPPTRPRRNRARVARAVPAPEGRAGARHRVRARVGGDAGPRPARARACARRDGGAVVRLRRRARGVVARVSALDANLFRSRE